LTPLKFFCHLTLLQKRCEGRRSDFVGSLNRSNKLILFSS